MIIFDDYKGPEYKYIDYASIIEYECRCGEKIKITGSENFCNQKLNEFIENHNRC